MNVATLEETTGITVLDYLDRELEVPILTGVQRQGDVLVLPAKAKGGEPIPREGIPVVRGEVNTHTLLGDGVWADAAEGLRLGYLTVSTEAVLAHPEHGFMRIGPGGYEIRRQREQADMIRMVAD